MQTNDHLPVLHTPVSRRRVLQTAAGATAGGLAGAARPQGGADTVGVDRAQHVYVLLHWQKVAGRSSIME